MEQKYHWHLQQNFSINFQYCTVCFLYWSKPLHWLNPIISYSKDPKGEKKKSLHHYNFQYDRNLQTLQLSSQKQSIFESEMNILPQILRSTGIRKKIQWMSISPVTPPLCKSLPAATWEILAPLEIRLCHCRHQTYTDWRWQG